MARYGWRGDSSLEDELFAEPYRFEFFQAVRLLELRSRGIDSAPAAAGDDVVRFRASYDLSFPPSEIRELAKAGPDSPPRMTVSFFGAGGLDGPLPTSFTEAILERLIFSTSFITGCCRSSTASTRNTVRRSRPRRRRTTRPLDSCSRCRGSGCGRSRRKCRRPPG
jgi:Type VI secretion, TssG